MKIKWTPVVLLIGMLAESQGSTRHHMARGSEHICVSMYSPRWCLSLSL
jgi:hypothetical protein